MKINLKHLKFVLVIGIFLFLYGFGINKNSQREIKVLPIDFVGKNAPFITAQNVSKLLIQNQEAVTNKPKETLDLNQLEAALNSNPMIKSAQVFMHVNGALKVEVEQKKPIARVHAVKSYYIDSQGSYMPLSSNHTARVPLVIGTINKDDLTNVFIVANKVYKDAFLKKHVVEIHQDNDKSISLKLRNFDFVVELGDIKLLDKKINNLKAFYKKGLKDNILDSYKEVNLKFDNQVVCTKT